MGANRTFFALLTFSTIALVGLTTLSVKVTPLLLSHAVYICQKTFSNVLFTISHSIPLFLITLSSIVLLIGFTALVTQVIKTRTYLKRNLGKKALFPSILRLVVDELNLNGKIDIVEDKNKFSFCYGLLKPRICLSTGFVKALSPDELKAVLLHESYHLKNRDPLKIILGKTISSMFFFIPILLDLQRHYVFIKEIAADEVAIKNINKNFLISALAKLLVSKTPHFGTVAALGSLDNLEKRILYLTDKQRKVTFRPSILSVSLSSLVVVLSLAIVNVPVYAVSQEGSTDHSLFVCPFGDSCALSCQAEKEINYTKNLLYTPLTDTP